MKTQLASKFTLKFLTIAKNWPVLLLAAFLLTGCPSGDGSGGAVPANPDAVGGDQRVTVTWDGSAGASSYNVYWSTASGIGTGGTLESVSASPFYHDGVTNAQPYYYVVTAVNDAGESGASGEVTATPVDILLSSLSFADNNLSGCVNGQRKTYVHELTSLMCPGDATDITDITNITNITNITGIEALTSLTELNLRNNTIDDVSALAGLTSLTNLNLRNNTIDDVSALAGLTSLTFLRLDSNFITNVSALAGLTNLTNLELESNTIGGQDVGNVDDLVSLVNADTIDLTGNIDMSCSELTTLIGALNSESSVVWPTTAVADGVDKNCTNPPLI